MSVVGVEIFYLTQVGKLTFFSYFHFSERSPLKKKQILWDSTVVHKYINNTVARDYRRVSFYIGNFAERRILRMACEIRITHYCDMSLCAHVNYITNTLFIKFAFILLSPSQNLVIFTLFSSYYLHYRLKCFKYMASIV